MSGNVTLCHLRSRLLDIGCGHGEFGALLVARGWKVAGVDLDPLQIVEASKRGLEATHCDLTQGLPHESGTFDAVFAAEVARVLKPGGAFVLTTPNLASFENRVRLLLGIYPIWVDYRLGGMGQVRAYTSGVLRRQLATHGLIVEKHRGNG